MESEVKSINEKLMKLFKDVELIKSILELKKDTEGELSNWAKSELEHARKRPEKDYISLEEIKKRIISKK